MNRGNVKKYRLLNFILVFVFLLWGVFLSFSKMSDATLKYGLVSVFCLLSLTSYRTMQKCDKEIKKFREEDCIGETYDVLQMLFSKYEYYRFKNLDFVEHYFKLELYDELNRIMNQHSTELKDVHFYYDISDDEYSSKKLEVIIETDHLDFSLFYRTPTLGMKMFTVRKQINALAIS